MHPHIVVGTGPHGRGLFATGPISAGELVLVFVGPHLTRAETIDSPIEAYTVQVGPDDYINPAPPGCFINHSCQPNTRFSASDRLVASRDIRPGEELFFDYSTSMDEDHWTLLCECGVPGCRGRITDFKWLAPDVQQHYLARGMVPTWLVVHLGGARPAPPVTKRHHRQTGLPAHRRAARV